jgi:L-ribulose-5-phosphate 3-epimerase
MKTPNRREFIQAGASLLTLAALSPTAMAAETTAANKRAHKKAIMWGTVGVKGSVLDKMQAVKAAGFDGAELASHMDQPEVLKARDATGLEITSVCGERHWKQTLSHPDPKVRKDGLAALQQTLRDAKAYGAGSILLVPGVVNNEVSFDVCWKRSIEQIRLAIPLAEELGVKISIENVWNNFITSEDQAVRYLDEINSPWVGWHFDCGNIIRYGDPIVWIKALGKRINRVHIKEYSRDRAMRSGDVWKGFNSALLEGANNWPGIMKALDEVGYQNYLITEQGGGDTPEGLHDLSTRLDKIIAL